MDKETPIVGIAGLSRSGKDTLAQMLIQNGYFGESLGDITREFALKRHANEKYPISRVNLAETSNWLRETRGTDIVMKIALERYQEAVDKGGDYRGVLCWSIRAPIEADYILARDGELIWIDVSDEVRYKRAMADLRSGEPHLSFKEYLAQERTVFKPVPGIPAEIQMDLPYVKSKATKIIVNNSDNFEEFKSKAQKIISDLKF